jgi:hypothetical protein
VLRVLRCSACERQWQQPAVAVVPHLLDSLVTQPGIDYGLWARQQQALRCLAAMPARGHAAVQDNVDAVAERKLQKAHLYYHEIQKKLEGE